MSPPLIDDALARNDPDERLQRRLEIELHVYPRRCQIRRPMSLCVTR